MTCVNEKNGKAERMTAEFSKQAVPPDVDKKYLHPTFINPKSLICTSHTPLNDCPKMTTNVPSRTSKSTTEQSTAPQSRIVVASERPGNVHLLAPRVKTDTREIRVFVTFPIYIHIVFNDFVIVANLVNIHSFFFNDSIVLLSLVEDKVLCGRNTESSPSPRSPPIDWIIIVCVG